MSDEVALRDALKRALQVFSLAWELGQKFEREIHGNGNSLGEEGMPKIRYRTEIEALTTAIAACRDIITKPRRELLHVAEFLRAAGKVAQTIRDEDLYESFGVWGQFPELNTIGYEGNRAAHAVVKAQRLDDPLAFMSEAPQENPQTDLKGETVDHSGDAFESQQPAQEFLAQHRERIESENAAARERIEAARQHHRNFTEPWDAAWQSLGSAVEQLFRDPDDANAADQLAAAARSIAQLSESTPYEGRIHKAAARCRGLAERDPRGKEFNLHDIADTAAILTLLEAALQGGSPIEELAKQLRIGSTPHVVESCRTEVEWADGLSRGDTDRAALAPQTKSLCELAQKLADNLEREASKGPSLGRMVESPIDSTKATFEYYPSGDRWPATSESIRQCRDALTECPQGFRDRIGSVLTRAEGFATTRDAQTIAQALPQVRHLAVELRTLAAEVRGNADEDTPPADAEAPERRGTVATAESEISAALDNLERFAALVEAANAKSAFDLGDNSEETSRLAEDWRGKESQEELRKLAELLAVEADFYSCSEGGRYFTLVYVNWWQCQSRGSQPHNALMLKRSIAELRSKLRAACRSQDRTPALAATTPNEGEGEPESLPKVIENPSPDHIVAKLIASLGNYEFFDGKAKEQFAKITRAPTLGSREAHYDNVGSERRRTADGYLAAIKQIEGVDRLQAYCDAHGVEWSKQGIQQLKGRLCEALDCTPGEIDRLSVVTFRQRLREVFHGTAPTSLETDAGEKRQNGATQAPIPPLRAGADDDADGTDSPPLARDQAGQSDDALPAKQRKLAPSRIKARAIYDWALSEIPGAQDMSISELFNAIEIHPKVPSDALAPNAETFGKYLRDAGVKRYSMRKGKSQGKSIQDADKL